ncbi:hypothetical protein [Pseudorhodoferax soli]|uniref:Uncharacterized protein n=1 Tax=Pseudorhodoferax soli TaxID=545864 RepID=A0A368XBM3_9BURK|nr:hypothetical protein [Pseudorhodoferax soli]RCW65119.1 hypothetical protein DES41_11343 [Pseudorhodoferax soli]
MSVSVTSVSSGVAATTVNLAPSATEAPSTKKSSTPSTIVSISKESTNNQESTGVDGEYTESPGATLQLLSPLAQAENRIKANATFSIEPRQAANSALRTANAELVRLQDRISANRPTMLGKTWDFVLKDNKIEVVNDNLSDKDRQWLENTLNKNQKLVSSVQNFYGAVTKFYDHTAENSAATGRNSTGTEYAGYVINAGEQINGKLAIRDIMDRSMQSLNRPSNTLSPDTTKPYQNSILLVSTYLKFDAEPKFQGSQFDLSDPATANYLKENPGFQG